MDEIVLMKNRYVMVNKTKSLVSKHMSVKALNRVASPSHSVSFSRVFVVIRENVQIQAECQNSQYAGSKPMRKPIDCHSIINITLKAPNTHTTVGTCQGYSNGLLPGLDHILTRFIAEFKCILVYFIVEHIC